MSYNENRISETIGNVQAVIFDWDDTCIETAPAKIAQNIHIARQFGQNRTVEDVKELWPNMHFRDMLMTLCATDDWEATQKIVDEGYDAPEFAKRPISTFPSDLAALKRIGLHVGMLSAVSRALYEKDLRNYSYTDSPFDYTQTLEDTPTHKPDPRVFAPAIEWLATQHISPDQAIYLGDGLGDMNAAQGAGMKFVAITESGGFISAEEFAEHGVASLPGVHEFVNIIRRTHGQL